MDDELKALNLEKPRQRGPDSELAGSEVITIELVGEHLGLDRDAREFPGLTGVHRTTFARQAANLWRVKRLLQRRLAERLAGATAATG